MGETREESYSFEMNERIMETRKDVQKSIEREHFYVALLEDPKGLPSYFLGIDGLLRRNDCAYRLAFAIHSGLITYEGAVEELRKFSNDIIEKGRWVKAKGKWAIKGEWVQLPLWNQSELDQI